MPPIRTNPAQTKLPYWTIPNVIYRGVSGNVDVQRTLLNTGTAMTQNLWANYSEQARTAGQFYTPDYPLVYATIAKAFDLKDENAYKKQVEEMRTTLKDFARANWLMTLTRIKYAPKGKDTIVHNFGMRDKYEVQENFVGADGKLPADSPTNVYQSLLGTRDSIVKINGVINWLNDTSSYIWRVNRKPDAVDERVAGFNAYSGMAGPDCSADPLYWNVSLGVRFVASGTS